LFNLSSIYLFFIYTEWGAPSYFLTKACLQLSEWKAFRLVYKGKSKEKALSKNIFFFPPETVPFYDSQTVKI